MTPLVHATALTKQFHIAKGGIVRAVDCVDLVLRPGEALGLVGESGCGKSTVARLILRLLDPTSGRIVFAGEDITTANEARLRRLRRDMQLIFQNPHAALNPRRTVFASISEPLVVQGLAAGPALRARVAGLMAQVSLPETFLWRFPHELSGGQKQRVCIARALALDPKLVVLDEPTAALDVSVQAQILEFLQEMRQRLGLTYLFISHNLAVVRQLCDRVAVMYLGRIVEEGPAEDVFRAPRHPYTRALIDAALPPRAGSLPKATLAGDVPSPVNIPSGCRFHPRCSMREADCSRIDPMLQSTGSSGVACPPALCSVDHASLPQRFTPAST